MLGKQGIDVLDKVEMLERLTTMWKDGALNDDEFQQQKAAILSDQEEDYSAGYRTPVQRLMSTIGLINGRPTIRLSIFVLSFFVLLTAWIWWQNAPNSAPNSATHANRIANWSNDTFWDGRPVGPTNRCRVLKVTGSAELGMMSGPNWEQGYDTPYAIKEKIKAIGGLTTGIIYQDGQCKAAFQVNAAVDGTSYNWRAICPYHVDPNDPDVINMVMMDQCKWF